MQQFLANRRLLGKTLAESEASGECIERCMREKIPTYYFQENSVEFCKLVLTNYAI
jgi:hypothetical protein